MQDPASTSSGSVKSRWLVVALAAATFLLTTTPALGKRVVLTKFTGPQAAKAQKAVAAGGDPDEAFPAQPGGICGWCDFRRACPAGSTRVGHDSWAGLDRGLDPAVLD